MRRPFPFGVTMDESTTPLDAALRYAGWGWQVFPIFEPCSCTLYSFLHCACHRGRACASPCKHPRTATDLKRGVLDATADAAQLRSWWARWPRANVGVATGAPSGIWVLDVDPRHGGDESLQRLESEHDRLPQTATARTGGDGLHFLFRYSGPIRNKSAVADGLDIRGDGGYIVAAPSRHIDGGTYGWVSDPLQVAEAPGWLFALAPSAPSAPRAAGGSEADARIGEGRRHSTLMSVAGSLRRQGLSPAMIGAALAEMNRERCAPPLGDEEVAQIARSTDRYEIPPQPPVLVRYVAKAADTGHAQAPAPPIPDVPAECWREWFGVYRDTMGVTTEAPDVYHLGAALTVVGTVLRRRVYVDYGRRIYPNLYTLLLGPSASRKDTAIDRALPLLEPPDLRANGVTTLDTVASAEGLVEALGRSSAVLLHLSEMSIVLRSARRDGTSNIIPYLTKAYDCPPRLSIPTRKNPVTANDPFLALLGASTQDWFDGDVTEEDVRGGFLGRFLYLAGVQKPRLALPPAPDERAVRWLLTRLHGVVEELDRAGPRHLTLAADAVEWWDAWHREEDGHRYEGDLEVLFKRIDVHIMKIALIYAAIEECERIGPQHLAAAAALVRISQKHVELSHPKWGGSPDGKLAARVLEFVAGRGGVATKREIHQRLSGRVPSNVFKGVITALVQFDRLAELGDGRLALPARNTPEPPAATPC